MACYNIKHTYDGLHAEPASNARITIVESADKAHYSLIREKYKNVLALRVYKNVTIKCDVNLEENFQLKEGHVSLIFSDQSSDVRWSQYNTDVCFLLPDFTPLVP